MRFVWLGWYKNLVYFAWVLEVDFGLFFYGLAHGLGRLNPIIWLGFVCSKMRVGLHICLDFRLGQKGILAQKVKGILAQKVNKMACLGKNLITEFA